MLLCKIKWLLVTLRDFEIISQKSITRQETIKYYAKLSLSFAVNSG